MQKKRARIKTLSASLTVEAAVIIPLVAAFFVAILMFFRIIQIQGAVQEALVYTCRKTAASTLLENDFESLAQSQIIFRKNLLNQKIVEKYVVNGSDGISLIKSELSGEFVSLHAIYHIKIPIGFFHLNSISMEQTTQSRKWIGMDPKESNALKTYVYVTEYGTVYHMSTKCSFLDLTIKDCNISEISNLRNKNGHKYSPCNRCVEERDESETLYITDYGTCYHTDPSCSALKRTVYKIPFTEIGARTKCKKCGGD